MVVLRKEENNAFHLSEGNTPHFLPSDAQEPYKVSYAVTKFFRMYGLNLATNILRGVVETTMKRALESGQVSLGVREATRRTIGHSARTCSLYYEPADRFVHFS